jgi:hypothetical protein
VFSPRDYLISPSSQRYFLFQMVRSSPGLVPVLIADYPTWDEAARKGRLLGLTQGVHAWGRRDGEELYSELVMAQHPHAPWPEPWFPFERECVDEAPRAPGVYVIGDGRPAFIGDTDDLAARLSYHLTEPGICLEDVRPLLFSYRATRPPEDRNALRTHLVRTWLPRCNPVQ